MKKSNKKLNFKKLKSYKIFKWMELINFKFKLFKELRIYSVFHTLLLESVLNKILKVKFMNIKKYKNQNYIIEMILI